MARSEVKPFAQFRDWLRNSSEHSRRKSRTPRSEFRSLSPNCFEHTASLGNPPHAAPTPLAGQPSDRFW